ncbi:MAG: hypothetical protein JO332_17605 [Planctomycetaceae bacterium]|nr:hypothetical protein [Planctomycetaceae bacterium]
MKEATETQGSGPLRHGRHQVGVSTLASQWYCELKIDLKHRHPEIRTLSPALDRGTEAHEALSADATVISRKEFDQDVADGKELFLQESRFQADIEGVPVIGVPDLVHLRGRRCELVLEMKFSRRPTLYIDRYVQAQTYALLLARNGFDLDRTPCVVGVVQAPLDGTPDDRFDSLKRNGILQTILDRCRTLRSREPLGWRARGAENPVTIREGPVTLQAFPFDPKAVMDHLRWAFDFWKSRRDPLAAVTAAKCKVCPYNAARVCAVAKAAPDRAFDLRTIREDGKDIVEVRRTR